MNEQLFVGVDHSLLNNGLVVLDENAKIKEKKLFGSPDSKMLMEKRLLDIMENFKFLLELKPEIVYIEGPAFQAKGRSILEMGALHYLIRIFLFVHKINYKIIAPTTLKKFVTGSGRGKKELMLLKVYKKFGVEFEDHNLADAYSLARMALEESKNARTSRGTKISS